MPRILLLLVTLMSTAPGLDAHPDTQLAGKGTAALDVHAHGPGIELLVAEDQPGGHVLIHRRSSDGGASWSRPVTIEVSRGKVANPGRNYDPQIVGAGQLLVAVWTAPSAVSKFSGGDLATAVSRDGGLTWALGGKPNDDTGGGEHAFMDAVADSKGTIHLAWLDSRDGQQGLRFSSSADGGITWRANQSIDTETCECCWNDVVLGWDDAVMVLYRDVPRDMAIARSDDRGATWRRTGTVGAFKWDIQGCPDVGGGIVRGGANGELFAIVFTGQAERRGLYTLTSKDNGRSWTSPLRVGPDRGWHADVAFANGVLYAAWDVNSPNGGIGWATSRDGGRTWRDGGQVSSPGLRATHPKLAVSNGRVSAFWTERDAEGVISWRSAPLSFPAGATAVR